MDKENQFMFDCLGRLLAAAERDQETARILLSQLQEQTNGYERRQQKFRQEISESVRLSLQSAVEKSVNDITDEFDNVKEKADEAAKRYEKSSRWAIWKIVVTGLILSGVFIGIAFAFLKIYLPSYSEIESFILQRDKLVDQIEMLKKRGALAEFADCEDRGKSRLCVRVDEANRERYFGKDGTYIIVHGY